MGCDKNPFCFEIFGLVLDVRLPLPQEMGYNGKSESNKER
jgi:hypothetical protein